MNRHRRRAGISLLEVVIAAVLSAIVMAMLWRGALFVQATMAQQVRLDRLSQVLDLTQEISQAVESSRRVLAVGPDQLDLEVYNFAAYNIADPRLYEHTQRIRYVYRPDISALVREVYVSTIAATPDSSKRFLTNANPLTPTVIDPDFAASYLVAQATVGVRVSLRIQTPFSKEPWTPVKREVYVRSQ
jgi:hypothetical protein